MIAGRKFHFRPVLTVCAGVALAVLIALGNWQLQRLEWKRGLIDNIASLSVAEPQLIDALMVEKWLSPGDVQEYRTVYAEGRFLSEGHVNVFGSHEGAPGHFAFVPLSLNSDDEHSTILYVNRGFVPYAAESVDIAPPPDGVVRVEGLLRVREMLVPPASWFRKAGADADGFWYVRDPVAMAKEAGLASPPQIYIDQFASGDEAYPKGGTTRLDFRNKHLEYALTWFGLAGALIVVWLTVSFSRK